VFSRNRKKKMVI